MESDVLSMAISSETSWEELAMDLITLSLVSSARLLRFASLIILLIFSSVSGTQWKIWGKIGENFGEKSVKKNLGKNQ